MNKIKEWWNNVKKYNFDEAIKVLDTYENDYKYKGYVQFYTWKPNDNEKKTIFIVKLVIIMFVLLFSLVILYFLFKNFDEKAIRLFVIISSAFFMIAIILCLIFPDKTKYAENIKVNDSELIIKLLDKKDNEGKIYKYNLNNSNIEFRTHYHRDSDDSLHEDGLNLYVNDEKFYISNAGKIIELNVFQIYVMSIKNGTNAREELAKIYKW